MGELLTRRRFTVEEYHRMGEAGIFPEDNRLELIAGDIIVREPIGAYHAGTVDRLNRLWTSRVGDRAIVRVEICREPLGDRYGTVRVLTRSERVFPEAFPDVAIDVADLIG